MMRTLAQNGQLLLLAFCLTLLLSACGRRPSAVDERPGAITHTYPPTETQQ